MSVFMIILAAICGAVIGAGWAYGDCPYNCEKCEKERNNDINYFRGGPTI